MGEGENLAPFRARIFWLACTNLINKNTKIHCGDFIKFRVLNLAFKTAMLIECYFLYDA